MEEREKQIIRNQLPDVIELGDMKSIVIGLQYWGPPRSFFQHLVRLREIHAAIENRVTPEAQEYFNRQVKALKEYVELSPDFSESRE